VGKPQRLLVAEEDLLILVDEEGLVMMDKETASYRRDITERLRAAFQDDRFCRAPVHHRPAVRPQQTSQ